MSTESLSFSNTLSKGSVYESFSMLNAYLEDEASRIADEKPEAISNEQIQKDDIVLETYRVEADAIHGGMGSVWRVHHLSWNTDLAMKRPQPRFFAEGSERRKEEFIAECEHWINLGLHPNIVSCYYVREIGGVPTIFSEWMEGGSLKDAIQSGRLYEGTEREAQARILDIAIQTARGLGYSHEQGLIHQDVKPGNILLTGSWDAKVADFGLAKARSRLTDGEQAISTGYTPEYCPREQAEGAAAEPWMDVYAWALTVAEMFAGKRRWTTGAEAGERLPDCLDQARVAVPEAMKELLTRCISPEQRREANGFGNVVAELSTAYHGVIGAAYPRSDAKAVTDTADTLNNRALSFIDLGMPDFAEGLWRLALEITPNHLNSVYNQGLYLWRKGEIDDEEVMRRCAAAETGSPSGLEEGWYDVLCTERGVWEDKPFGESATVKVFRSVGKSAPPRAVVLPDKQRLWLGVSRLPNAGEQADKYGGVYEIWCLDTQSWERVYTIPGGYYFRLSDDQDHLLYAGEDGKSICVAQACTGKLIRTLRCDKEVKGCALHPDGRRMIVQTEQTIQLWDIETGAWLKEAETPDKTKFTLSGFGAKWRFMDDGASLAQFSTSNYLKWNTTTLELEQNSVINPSGNPCFSRDGAWAVNVPRGEFERIDCTKTVENKLSGREKTRLLSSVRVRSAGDRNTTIRALVANDTRILASAANGTVKLYDDAMRRCLCTFFGHSRKTSSACAPDDLSVIVTCSADDSGTVRIFKGQAPVVKAPWALCVVRSFDEAKRREDILRAHEAKVTALIESGDLVQAVNALREAEAQDGAEGSSQIRALRRRLTGLIAPRHVESVTENGGFRPEPERDSVVQCIAADPLDRFLAISSGYSWQHPSYGLWSMDYAQIHTIDEEDSPDTLIFSRTGRYLAAAMNDSVQLCDMETRNMRRIAIKKEMNPNGDLRIDFSDDERTLLAGPKDDLCGTLIDTASGKIKKRYGFETTYVDYRLSADAARLYAATYHGTLRELDAQSGRVLREKELNVEICAVALSPDGQRLYISIHLKDDILVWDVSSWREIRRIKCDLGKSINVRFEPSNRLMALFSESTGGALGHRIQLRSLPDCRVVTEIKTASEDMMDIAFSADGCFMYACCGNMVRVWELRWRLDRGQEEDSEDSSLSMPLDQTEPENGAVECSKSVETPAVSHPTDSEPKPAQSVLWEENIGINELMPGNYIVAADPILGGMNRVWKVMHFASRTYQAMIRPARYYPGAAGAARWGRFVETHRLWAGLGRHQNVVACFEVKEINGVPTAFAEWLDGGTLKEAIQSAALYEDRAVSAQRRVLGIAVQSANGLKHIHEQHVVHGDVKPGNILLVRGSDTVKINDFGLSRRVIGADGTELDAPASGYTLEYCPKEQTQGEPLKPWMDVYAWALTVLEMYHGWRVWKNGAEAKDHLDDYISGGRLPLPGGMEALLRSCIEGKTVDFETVEEELSAIIPAAGAAVHTSHISLSPSQPVRAEPQPHLTKPPVRPEPQKVQPAPQPTRPVEQAQDRGLFGRLKGLFSGKKR